jgi:hypothetical protein
MSAFSADWLALREPADRAARNSGMLATVAAAFAARDALSVVDLGCGTGSTLRCCAPAFAQRQEWILVDRDADLLESARRELHAWADVAETRGDTLVLTKAHQRISVIFHQADLADGLGCVRENRVDLVTASALFDLVTPAWIHELVTTLRSRQLPLYAALTYNGEEAWAPAHPDDAIIHRAFLAHMRGDKGFGPSAGAAGGDVLAAALSASGYAVATASSPWRLDVESAELTGQVANGIAEAAAATGSVSEDIASAWASFRAASAATADALVVIGHVDLWAPPL